MISFERANKSFRKPSSGNVITALNDVCLQVSKGEIFGIIGTSGAGKSTLLRMINKLEQPDSGRVVVNGRVINELDGSALKRARQEIGMIFQHFNLLNSIDVYHNIVFPLKISREFYTLSKSELDNILKPILELTGLTDLLQQYPSQLSGGQKQRVAIARSLITRPKILLCDECTSALDPETTTSILELLKKINQELGVTIVLITHEMEVIKAVCDKVAVMSKGLIVETGTVLDLYTNAQHQNTRNLLSRSLINKLPNNILHSLILNNSQDIGTYSADLNYYPLLQLAFIDEVAAKPILSKIIRDFDLDFNILQGEIETIQNTIVGRLLVQLEASEEIYLKAKHQFEKYNISIEIVGYAPRIYS